MALIFDVNSRFYFDTLEPKALLIVWCTGACFTSKTLDFDGDSI